MYTLAIIAILVFVFFKFTSDAVAFEQRELPNQLRFK